MIWELHNQHPSGHSLIEALCTQELELMHAALLVSGVRFTVALFIKVISQVFIKIDLLTLDRLTKIALVGKEGVLMNNSTWAVP